MALRCLLGGHGAAGGGGSTVGGSAVGTAPDTGRLGGVIDGTEDDQEIAAAYDGPRTAPPDRPYVLVNMVTSLDGATAVDGVSKALGSSADRAVFHRLRGMADAIVVGAGTMRAERYGPPRIDAATRQRRQARQQAPVPIMVVVSRSMHLDWSSAFFRAAERRPVVVTSRCADRRAVAQADGLADLIQCGDDQVDLAAGLRHLRDRGVDVALCEGGPSLNADLFAAGLVDELCVTVAPTVVGGTVPRGIVADRPEAPEHALRLVHVLEADGFLLLRYLVH